MNAYIYQANLHCEGCGRQITDAMKSAGLPAESWPQGPYANGGGEADSPRSCESCYTFLMNPLTPDGIQFVQDLVDDQIHHDGELSGTPKMWADYYGIEPTNVPQRPRTQRSKPT